MSKKHKKMLLEILTIMRQRVAANEQHMRMHCDLIDRHADALNDLKERVEKLEAITKGKMN